MCAPPPPALAAATTTAAATSTTTTITCVECADPRKALFEQIAGVMAMTGKTVPVFNGVQLA